MSSEMKGQKSSERRILQSMKRYTEVIAAVVALMLFGFAMSTSAQIVPPVKVVPNPINPGGGTVIHPQSSAEKPGDAGVRAHTNVQVLMPNSGLPSPYETPPFPGYFYETPASLACLYNLVASPPAGCNPNNPALTNPTGGSKTIAIVDAYDDPYAAEDLAWFSLSFNIPFNTAQFQVVYASPFGAPENTSGGWELEESMDIEYAHAMAPGAKIYLVEAYSNYYGDLAEAINVATNLVLCGKTSGCPASSTGTGEVSMSWGSGEYPGETLAGNEMCLASDGTGWLCSDGIFTTNNGTGTGGSGAGNAISGVVFFAAAGDYPGTSYPCTSPYVVCVGGTTTTRNYLTGNFEGEDGWTYGGGGASAYETIPSYQSGVGNIPYTTGVTGFRGVPDVSSDANPFTGVWVYDSYPFGTSGDYYYYGWILLGGTSLSTPTWAGIVNNAGSFAASSTAELTTLYANRHSTADFNDIVYGFCGPYASFTAIAAWDPCTGIGSPHSTSGK
jgi:kumamolisin